MPAGRLAPDDRALGRRLRAAPICVPYEPGRSVGSAGAVRRAPGWDVSQGRRPGAGPAVPLRGAALTVAQLQTFLQRARTDRFFALWVLEATSGMRRCELAGARRDLLDLAAGTLEIDVTRVVVDGQVIESDGKTENAQHLLALDPFTLAALKAHVEMLDRERKDHGPDYRDHGVLFCWEDGTPPHPDTITRRFKQLAAAAGLPEIDLHDVRHSYATAGRDAKIDWKALS
jgi:integrase